MGLFGKNDPDKAAVKPVQDTLVNDLGGIDFTKYDLSTLGDDVASIVSIPGAVKQAAKWTFGLPIAIGILTAIVYSSRMSDAALVLFVLVAMSLSAFVSLFIGGYFVARKRLDLVSEATTRVVTVVNEMHTDVVQLKEGASTTSVKAVSKGLLEHAVFPMAFGFVEGMNPTKGGIMSKLGSRVTEAPMKLVQKSVISAVDRLPDKMIGNIVDDVTGSVPAVTTTLADLNAAYQKVAGDIGNVVAGVSKATLTSTLIAAVLAMVPLAGWLLLGWVVT